MIFNASLGLVALALSLILAVRVGLRVGLTLTKIGSGNTFGFGVVYGQQMLAVSFAWWNWRLDWKGTFDPRWKHTRPIRKGEIPRGSLYEHTIARGLNKTVKKAKKDKYHHLYEGKKESRWKRLKAWLLRRP